MYDADICLRYCQICWVFLGIPRNLAGSAHAAGHGDGLAVGEGRWQRRRGGARRGGPRGVEEAHGLAVGDEVLARRADHEAAAPVPRQLRLEERLVGTSLHNRASRKEHARQNYYDMQNFTEACRLKLARRSLETCDTLATNPCTAAPLYVWIDTYV